MRAFEGAGASLEQLRQLRRRLVRQPSYKTYSLTPCYTSVSFLTSIQLVRTLSQPRCFLRDASFETFDPTVLVFDYPETFVSNHIVLRPDFLRRSKGQTRGILVEVWMNLYTCSQPVVLAKISRPSPQSDIDLLLVGSLPDYGLLKYHLAEKSSKKWDKLSSQSASPEAFAYLQYLIMHSDRGIPRQEPVANAVFDYEQQMANAGILHSY